MLGVYGGGSALGVGGGAPLSAVSITVGPNPMASGRRLSTLDGGSARSPGHALARLGRASVRMLPGSKREAKPGRMLFWSPGADREAQGGAALGVRLVALRHARPRPRLGMTRYRRPRHARMPSGRARMRQDRRGPGGATLGRPDARTQHGASYARAGEVCRNCTLSPDRSGHEKARATHRLPGSACLGSA